uniref:Exonuclease, RNase T and DNA polymerase III n=1 Tax=mine drainage metagenome TaxID=410659 RepID=E6QNX4_9ZZZZ
MPMNDTHWVLLDTETNGLRAPIYAVELAAQRMVGWEPEGEPFRRLLNQNVTIPPEASRVNGYTREILERDGDSALDVYADFRRYACTLPLVSYNLAYDLDQVLLPEWERLDLAPIGQRGFCALELARRLLDPVPAGNCKLQTLRQFYHLPERGAHTALGDVQTVIDLMSDVLQPLAKKHNLQTFASIRHFTESSWQPRRIPFGKHKGRDFHEALKDPTLRDWFTWLTQSENPRSSAMGQWYLDELERLEEGTNHLQEGLSASGPDLLVTGMGPGIVIYRNLELEQVRQLISAARGRLAEVQTEYTQERMATDAVQSKLFILLRPTYQKRDRLKLSLFYREKFLHTLLSDGDVAAEDVKREYQRAKIESEAEYEKAATDAEANHELTAEEASELKGLWRKLCRLFHPDYYSHDEEHREVYERLMQRINRAKDEGDIATLREIAEDHNGYLLKHGEPSLDFSDRAELVTLRRLHESLQSAILEALEELNRLRESAEYELYQLYQKQPEILPEIAQTYEVSLSEEIVQIEQKLVVVDREISELNEVP